jgi:hypothetical protein
MLERCRRDQWSPSDIDWSRSPRPMSVDDERRIVQLFTDMAGIERLAAALFREQEKRAKDPTLKAIFATFVQDEIRHAQVAQMLADHYDVRGLRAYAQNESLRRFFPYFVGTIGMLSDDVANAYVTTGELILDIALLRSIDDFVQDETSAAAMRLINRDESRHIAIDYYMVEHYASPEYRAELAERTRGLVDRMRAWWTFSGMLWFAYPFMRDVFLEPMDVVDASGQRLGEAMKRFQQLLAKPGVRERPFGRFIVTLQDLYHHPIAGRLLGRVLARISGVGGSLLQRLNSEAELAEAARKSYEELANEALAIKRAES